MALMAGGVSVAAAVLQAAEQEEQARKRRMARAWQRYWGDYPKTLAPSPTDPLARDNTRVNLARRTVDISAFYLFGKPVDFDVTGDGNEAASEYLAAVWDANRQMTMLLEFATGAGIHGDGFLRLHPAGPGEKYPRVVPLDPQNVRVDCDPADVTREARFLVEYNAVDLTARRVANHRHRMEREEGGWRIFEERSYGDELRWNVVREVSWPYPFPPIFHSKNLSAPFCYYGRSDIEEDVLALNWAINFVLSNINRVLRVHGHPQTYVTGLPTGSKLDRAVDGVWAIPSEDARVGTVPHVEDLASHFTQLQKLRDAYHELTCIPEVATGKLDNVGELSGLALEILYGPLVQLTQVKRVFYGEMLRELCQAVLVLGGFGEGLPVEIEWPQILPKNRAEEAGTAITLNEAGVSKETTLTEIGYDPEEEAERRDAEATADADRAARLFDRGGNADPNGPNNQNNQNSLPPGNGDGNGDGNGE